MRIKMKIAFFVSSLAVLFHVVTGVTNFTADCWWLGGSPVPVDCATALFFSHKNFSITADLIWFENDLFCDSDSVEASSSTPVNGEKKVQVAGSPFAVVNRGGCAFDVKAKTAMKRQFAGLVVVNSDDTVFPMGSSDLNFQSAIPVVAVGKSFWTKFRADSCRSETYVNSQLNIAFTNADPTPKIPRQRKWPDYLPSIGACLLFALLSLGLIEYLLVCSMSVPSAEIKLVDGNSGVGERAQTTWKALEPRKWLRRVQTLLIMTIFVVLRVATLRYTALLSDDEADGGRVVYNHNETDERIFEMLVRNVQEDWRNYRLSPEAVLRFRLAESNYNDRLFIHPPVFVYLCAGVNAVFGIPLPFMSVLFQLITVALLPTLACQLVSACSSSKNSWTLDEASSVGFTAIVVFLSCPIVHFISQKFWIDNCLMAVVTISVVVHLHCSTGRHWSILNHAVSGLVFGVLGLNCKITALAALPMMLCWTALQRMRVLFPLSANKAESNEECPSPTLGRVVSDIMLHCGVFICVALAAHSPWLFLYHGHTGRWLPNAWPSKEMLEKSAFLLKATQKSSLTYFYTLLTTSPLHCFGLGFGAVSYFLLVGNALAGSGCDRWRGIVFSPQLAISVFAIWPMSFLCGLTFLGIRGAGYQSRFLAPLLPATAVLAALTRFTPQQGGQGCWLVLLLYGGLHCVFYGVLFGPLYADIDVSVFDLLATVNAHPYHAPSTKEEYLLIFQYLQHFGIYRKIA